MEKKSTQIDFDGELQILDIDADDAPTEGPADFRVPDRKEAYAGRERRRGPRRQGNDRRGDLRFEPDKSDRRSGEDRRKGTWDVKYTI